MTLQEKYNKLWDLTQDLIIMVELTVARDLSRTSEIEALREFCQDRLDEKP